MVSMAASERITLGTYSLGLDMLRIILDRVRNVKVKKDLPDNQGDHRFNFKRIPAYFCHRK